MISVMSFHVRVCRECGEEYRPEIVRCADCGGELEDVYEDAGRPSPPPPPREPVAPPPDLSNHRVLFESARAADLVPFAERLREADLPFRLAERVPAGEGAPVLYRLLVHDDDARAALDLLGPLLAPDVDGEAASALETSYEAGRGYVQCPACGTRQISGAAECPECGLALGPAVPTCERCGAPLPEEGAACPACGGPSPTG
jgi:Double zinc ribbon